MDNKGFTLIELIVVFLLISISSSVIFLNISNNNKLNNKKFVSYFVRLLQKAKVESIVNDKTFILVINPEERKVYIKNSKKDSIKIPKDITITAEKIIEQDGKSLVYFFSNGSSTGMNINLYGKNISKKVVVNPISGFIKTMDIVI